MQQLHKPYAHRLIGIALLLAATIFALSACGSMNLFNRDYPTPASQTLAATAESSATSLDALNAEFSDANMDGLNVLMPELNETLRVQDGWLRMKGKPEIAGWYSDRSGPFAYRVVSGNFMVETHVRTASVRGETLRPVGKFNSTGLLARDASSTRDQMRWVMYNIGMQDGFYGTEAKNTVPFDNTWHTHRLAGFRSQSTLYLTPVRDGVMEATLRMCRVGNEFRFLSKLPGDTQWREEAQVTGTVVQGNGAGKPTPGVQPQGPTRFVRGDMPATLQVGLISNPGLTEHDGESRFDYLRFKRIDSFAACGQV